MSQHLEITNCDFKTDKRGGIAVGVSTNTSERVQKTKAALDEALARLRSAQSQVIDAERKHNDAMRAWEHEFFADADKRAKRLAERSAAR